MLDINKSQKEVSHINERCNDTDTRERIMARKDIDIDRQNSRPHVVQVRIEKDHDSVRWSMKGRREFRIWFPDEWNPLDPGDNVSQKGALTRTVSSSVTRGRNSHYPYAIFLIDSKEMVESDSPPEMVIE
jgi:hypothetical protein